MAKYHYAKENFFRLIRLGVSLKIHVIRLDGVFPWSFNLLDYNKVHMKV